MATQHKTLVSSTVLAAVATMTMLPMSADADVTLYTTEADMVADISGAGGMLSFMEDFEDHDTVAAYPGYAQLSNPLDSNANGVFTNGINAGLSISASTSNMSVLVPSPYTGNITSSVVGALVQHATTTIGLTGDDIHAVGFDAWGVGTFISSAMTDFDYTIFGTDGGVLGSGNYATPDAASAGQFFGVSSADAIGSIEIRGFAFGLDTGEFVDNVQGWSVAVPAPGALAMLGLAGLAGSRRRRG